MFFKEYDLPLEKNVELSIVMIAEETLVFRTPYTYEYDVVRRGEGLGGRLI